MTMQGAENGFRLRPLRKSSGTALLMSAFSGSTDVFFAGLPPALFGQVHGLPIRIVGTVNRLGRGHAVMLRAGVLDRQPERLLIATVHGSTGHYIGYRWAQQLDVPVVFLNLSPRDQIEAFAIGLIDGAAVWEPFCLEIEAEGGVRVYDASQLSVPSFNLIVATERAIERKGAALNRFLAVVQEATLDLARGETAHEDLAFLADTLNAPYDLREFRQHLRSHILWQSEVYREAPDSGAIIHRSLEDAAEFLRAVSLVPAGVLSVADSFPQRSPSQSIHADNELIVGYSDSVMCAPFQLALRNGSLKLCGFNIDHNDLSLNERVARLVGDYRHELRGSRQLIEHDPDAAVLKVGKISEQRFNTLADSRGLLDNNQALAKTLSVLEAANLVPRQILAYAHWIRTLRNLAAHEHGVTKSQAASAYAHVVDILEWYERSRQEKHVCRGCGAAIEDTWRFCPYCGVAND